MPAAAPHAVERLDPSAFPRALDTLISAFLTYPLMEYATDDPARRRLGVRTLYAAMLRDAWRYGQVDGMAECGAIACWLPPGVQAAGLWRQLRGGMGALPWRFGWRGFRRLDAYERAARRLHHAHAPQPHWYLAVIGVHPARQGQGLGSALIRHALDSDPGREHPCYLETHAAKNVRLYERLGFRVTEQFQPPGHPVPIWSMRRQASVAGV